VKAGDAAGKKQTAFIRFGGILPFYGEESFSALNWLSSLQGEMGFVIGAAYLRLNVIALVG